MPAGACSEAFCIGSAISAGVNKEALFRHAILGDLLSGNLRWGQPRPALKHLAQQTYEDHLGRSRRVVYKTLEEWFYK